MNEKGYCDGRYRFYRALGGQRFVCCLAHCRRKFYEAVSVGRRKKCKLLDINSEETIKGPTHLEVGDILEIIPAEMGLAYCNRLFFIERGLKKLPAEERKAKRMELETSVWEAFFKWRMDRGDEGSRGTIPIGTEGSPS